MAIPSLQSIFEAITPENIKNIPIVKIAMQVFIEELEKNSIISKKIRSLYDNEIYFDDPEKVVNAKERIKKGLYQYYISNLYNALKNITDSKEIKATLKKFGYTESKLFNQVEDNINTEFISSFRNFTQKVGTESAIEYIYAFAKYLESGKAESDVNIQTNDTPFVMHYEGSLNNQIFSNIVKPLSHPVGWCYTYTTLFTVILRDYFGIEIKYKFTKLELVNLSEGKYLVFTEKSVEDVYNDFRNRINPKTNELFTDEEISKNVQIFIRTVSDYQFWEDEESYPYRLISFTDDTVLYVDGKSGRTFFTTYEDYVLGLVSPISVFDSMWHLVTEMTTDIKFLYYDKIEHFEKYLDISRIRDTDHQIGDSQYFADKTENALNVNGDVYHFVPGFDESIDKVIEYDLNEYVHLGKIFYSQDFKGTLFIYDDFGNFITAVCSRASSIDLDTFALRGRCYSIYFKDAINQIFYFRASGLNYQQEIKIYTPEVITYTETKKYGLKVSGYTPFDNTVIILKDSSLRVQKINVNKGFFNHLFDTSSMTKGYFKIDGYNIVNKKKRNKCFFEANFLNTFDTTPSYVSIIQYANIQDKNWKYVPTFGTENMIGLKNSINNQKIGEKINGEYKPNEWLPQYLTKFNRQEIDEHLKHRDLGLILDGNIIEGENYYTSDYTHILDQCHFINKGYEQLPVGTSDFIITDSTRYVNDNFDADLIGCDYYLYAIDDYLITRDKYYLVSDEGDESEVHLYAIKMNNVIEIKTNAPEIFVKLEYVNTYKCELYYSEKLSEKRILSIINKDNFNDILTISKGFVSWKIDGKVILTFDVNDKFNYIPRKVVIS